MYDEQVEAMDVLGWLMRLSSTPRLLPVVVMETIVFLSARILREELFERPALFCGGRIGVWCYTPPQHTHKHTYSIKDLELLKSIFTV